MKIVKLKWILLSLLVILTGCSTDDLVNSGEGIDRGTHMELLLTLNVPGVFTSPSSYALTEDMEREITKIDVLVFKEENEVDGDGVKKETFLYATTGTTDLDGSGTASQKIKVMLQKSTGSEKHRIVVLANQSGLTEAVKAGFTKGDLKEDVLKKIVFDNKEPWRTAGNDYTLLPMWGEAAQCIAITPSTNSTSLGTITLYRAVARIDVGLQISSGSDAPKFEIDEVKLCDAYNQGRGAPNQSVYKDSLPSIPTSFEKTDITYNNAVNNYVREIYTTEAEAGETYLLVKGRYNEGTATWYRIDFYKRTSDESPEQVQLPLLRNYIYRINITSVSGPGYTDEEDAKKSRPMNMEHKVQLWNTGDISEVAFDGQYLLGISDKEFNFPAAESEGELIITTDALDIYDSNLGKVAIKLDYLLEDGKTTSSWLSQTGITYETNSDGMKKYTIKFKAIENTAEEGRIGYIRITANNRLKLMITVTQKAKIKITIAQDSYYALDGDPHSLTVKATVPWKAVLKTNPQSIITNCNVDDEIATGAANVTKKITFTTKDDITGGPVIWREDAEVEIQDEQGGFLETVFLRCISGTILQSSNSYFVAPLGSDGVSNSRNAVAIPVERANITPAEVLGTQIKNTTNFTAELLWTDNKKGMADDSNIKAYTKSGTGHKYIVVHAGNSPGNASIAAKIGTKIVWSWHIWVTEYDPGDGSEITTTEGIHELANGTGAIYNFDTRVFMDRNLGATTSELGTFSTYGLHYQWGRKDALILFSSYNETGVAVGVKIKSKTKASIADAIANPYTFYYYTIKNSTGSWYDWCDPQSDDLWGTNAEKTIYDPCPSGWRVPTDGGGEDTSPWKKINKKWADDFPERTGLNYPEMGPYPGAGIRIGSSGTTSMGRRGSYWSADPHTNSLGVIRSLGLDFSSKNRISAPDYNERSRGCSVRCVKE
ncbi:hypothetical protein GGR06_003018 [Bacteroides reticulotermitis]|uniref:Major fimbrial subunit protein N-terminal domain-containing protein n=1 Tax=Bacteroides reticulotermitis TaxID=1133319 RepID=A0A840CYL7_9BACE|nr:BACON domain-containing carbohydrate-binding protein [Bacteroides reticulotermitis]MBB4045207.1 hypothetical protein [Bacteroides reticulotermitis]